MRFLLVLALLAGCPQKRVEGPRASTPRPMEIIEASQDLDGKLVGASSAKATIVVLMASWCGHCRTQLIQLSAIQKDHPRVRILGVNYKGHEEYDNRGNATLLRAYVGTYVPWLRVVPAGEPLFDALGRPPFVPAVWVYNPRGELVQFFDRREREPPTVAEIEELLARLGA